MRNIKHSFIWVLGTLIVGLGILGSTQIGYAQQGNESQSQQGNASQSSWGSGGTGELSMMALDLDNIEEHITGAQNAIADANTVAALDHLSQIENLMATLEKQPQIMNDIKSIKDSLSNNDLEKATEDITKIQSQISQVKTQNPQLLNDGQDNDDNDDNDDNEDNE
ncbi:MAG: hypothetical protein MRJ93_03375 [Nitrososphaeraceae archaeon]|nr:hypothetical protein [Nitrososphaeraceae archaeon]